MAHELCESILAIAKAIGSIVVVIGGTVGVVGGTIEITKFILKIRQRKREADDRKKEAFSQDDEKIWHNIDSIKRGLRNTLSFIKKLDPELRKIPSAWEYTSLDEFVQSCNYAWHNCFKDFLPKYFPRTVKNGWYKIIEQSVSILLGVSIKVPICNLDDNKHFIFLSEISKHKKSLKRALRILGNIEKQYAKLRNKYLNIEV